MFRSPPRTADEILDDSFLDVRCRLLDLAAALDRIDAAGEIEIGVEKRRRIDDAIELLGGDREDRAAAMQMLFSRDYDPQWRERFAGATASAKGRDKEKDKD